MSEGAVHFSKADRIASVVLDRPEAYNAMTMAMYDQLTAACAAIAADSAVRVAIFRGAGEAFAAGTDIHEFMTFDSPDDGIAYEQRIDRGREPLRFTGESRYQVNASAAPRGGKRDAGSIRREIRADIIVRTPRYLDCLAPGCLLHPDMHHATGNTRGIREQLAVARERGTAECSRSYAFGVRQCGSIRPSPPQGSADAYTHKQGCGCECGDGADSCFPGPRSHRLRTGA